MKPKESSAKKAQRIEDQLEKILGKRTPAKPVQITTPRKERHDNRSKSKNVEKPVVMKSPARKEAVKKREVKGKNYFPLSLIITSLLYYSCRKEVREVSRQKEIVQGTDESLSSSQKSIQSKGSEEIIYSSQGENIHSSQGENILKGSQAIKGSKQTIVTKSRLDPSKIKVDCPSNEGEIKANLSRTFTSEEL